MAKERVQEVVEAMVRVQNKADEEEVLTGGKSNAVVSLKATTVEAAVKDDPTLSSRMERAGASGDAMEKALLKCCSCRTDRARSVGRGTCVP